MTSLSTLVVTNRPHFASWWTWNITKQTRRPDEVVVVSNMQGTMADLMCFHDVVKYLLDGIPVQVHFMNPATSIGDLRQTALDLSSGAVINYIDDDDWYHPWLFQEFVRGIERGSEIVTGAGHHRLILKELLLFRFDEIIDLIHLPFCAVLGSRARSLGRFAPTNLNEDIWWLEQLSTFAGKRRCGVPITMPVICMIHDRNTWNRDTISGYQVAIQNNSEVLTARAHGTCKNHRGVLEIPKQEWESTWRRLLTLRSTLGFEAWPSNGE